MKEDAEAKGMQAAYAALAGLKPEEQQRAVRWLAEKLGVANAAPATQTAPGGAGAGRSPPAFSPPGPNGVGVDLQKPKPFMAAKRPTSGPERMACLGFFLTNVRDTAQFKVKDLTKLNLEAAQPKIGNPSQASKDAVRAQFLTQVSRGVLQITSRGEAVVNALPDRERVKHALDENPLTRSRKANPKKKVKSAAK